MMDMGFWPDITRIVSELPTARQTLLFSATMPDEVMNRARAITRDARMIESGARNGPARTIHHTAVMVAGGDKAGWLAKFLRQEAGPVLVFVRTKIGADRLASRLIAQGIRTAALHADRTQQQRTAAVEGLKSGRFTALVATDLAARGLDIEGISHVVNYEVPSTREAYVHRVGRTGRAHLSGTAVTLVAPEERRAMNAIARELVDRRPGAGSACARRQHSGSDSPHRRDGLEITPEVIHWPSGYSFSAQSGQMPCENLRSRWESRYAST